MWVGAVDEIGHAVAFMHSLVMVDLLRACLTAVLGAKVDTLS